MTGPVYVESWGSHTSARDSRPSVQVGKAVYVECWGSVVVKCLCCLVARLG